MTPAHRALVALLAAYVAGTVLIGRFTATDEIAFKAAGREWAQRGRFAAPELTGFARLDPPVETIWFAHLPIYTFLFGVFVKLFGFGAMQSGSGLIYLAALLEPLRQTAIVALLPPEQRLAPDVALIQRVVPAGSSVAASEFWSSIAGDVRYRSLVHGDPNFAAMDYVILTGNGSGAPGRTQTLTPEQEANFRRALHRHPRQSPSRRPPSARHPVEPERARFRHPFSPQPRQGGGVTRRRPSSCMSDSRRLRCCRGLPTQGSVTTRFGHYAGAQALLRDGRP